MPRKVRETSAVRDVGVVKTRILGFYAVKGAVEVGGFNSNFGNKISVYVSGEGSWIALSGAGKEGFVDEG